MKNNKTKKMVLAGLLTSLSLLLIYLIRTPLIPSAPFLIYEPGDIPLLVLTFVLGPGYAIIATVAVSVLQALFFSTDGWVGALMHIISTSLLVGTAGLIYRKMHTFKGALLSLICGTLAMTIGMVAANLTITVWAYGYPLDAVKALLLPAIIPFNLLKAGINSLVSLLIYKRASKQIHKFI